jgi:hypothetical protein
MLMSLIVTVVLLFAGCRREHDAKAAAPAPAPAANAAPVTRTAAATPATVIVKGADGADVVTIGGSASSTVISYEEWGQKHTLRGDLRDSGKRKYGIDGGPVAYEVKPGDDGGFKLRTEGGALLWKVKITGEKIKISNNEQNDHPFELKVREQGRFKVVAPGDRELGNVRFDAGASRVEVENASGRKQFEIASAASSAGYGVLLLDGIPSAERFMLLAEIVRRGR